MAEQSPPESAIVDPTIPAPAPTPSAAPATQTPPITLQVDQVSKNFVTPGGTLEILRHVSFTCQAGDGLALMGPSGSGKSTLLHLLGGLDTPTSGTITLGEQTYSQWTGRVLAQFRNRTVGFVFQDHYLLPQCSVLENVLIPALPGGAVPDGTVQRAKQLLERVGLAARADHRPAELSGGERQRAALARALINRPALLLGDEPTGNLDQASAAVVADLLVELYQQDQCILIVATHSTELANRFPRRFHLRSGQLVPSETIS